MTTESGLQNLPAWRKFVVLVAGVLGLFAGLCTIFALVVTTALGWKEHAQAQWPETTAQVERCGVDIYMHRPKTYWIDCRLSYTVGGDDIVSHVHSRSTPAPQRLVYQYPAGRYERMQDWVDAHPQGTSMRVHYDPANPRKAVLVQTDMPLGGPQTPNNLRLLVFCAISCVLLVTINRIARPRPSVGIGLS